MVLQSFASPHEELCHIIEALRARGHSDKVISASAGYSGTNGKRDVTSMLDGRCKKLEEKLDRLREYMREKDTAKGPAWSAEAPAKPTKDISGDVTVKLRNVIFELLKRGHAADEICAWAGYKGSASAANLESMLEGRCQAAPARLAALELQLGPVSNAVKALNPLTEIRAVIDKLRAAGRSDNLISGWAGYSGANGPRDVQAMYEGRCRAIEGRLTALRAHVPLPEAPQPEDPWRSDGGSAWKMEDDSDTTFSEGAESDDHTGEPRGAEKAVVIDKLRALVTKLRGMNVSDKTISQWAGYSGSNGKRDVTALVEGYCTKPLERLKSLRGHAATATPVPPSKREASAKPASASFPDGIAAKPVNPPGSKPLGGVPLAGISPPSKPLKTDPAATPAFQEAASPAPLDRLCAVIEALRSMQMSDKTISVTAGYSGSNGKRDVTSMIEGRCKEVPEKLARLEAALASAQCK